MGARKIDIHDKLQQHCRSLGHRVPFQYCRRMNLNLPCHRLCDCWENTVPVREFIRLNYTDEERASFFAPAKPKLAQIYELMKKAESSGSE